MGDNNEVSPDFGLVRPVSLPADGRMPDAVSGASSRAEYDGYFRLVREQSDFLSWSRSCLDVQRRVLADLESTDLSAQDRYDILAGCVVVLLHTLERWHSRYERPGQAPEAAA
ncbi:hypothetical protein [Actinophytocola xanthii]|nr:hypothetical protein [Actinophytocola xanthii]